MKSNAAAGDLFMRCLPAIYSVLIPCAVYDLWWLIRPVGTVILLVNVAYVGMHSLQRWLQG